MPWGGGTSYGPRPWGSTSELGIEGFPVDPVLDVEVLSLDTLLITLSEPFPNDEALAATSTYTILGTTAVEVFAVQTGGDEISTESVLLTVKGLIVDGEYTLSMSTTLVTSENEPVEENSFAFKGRQTKMDVILQRLPPIYTKAHDANLTKVLLAISREDDRIGGNQDEEPE